MILGDIVNVGGCAAGLCYPDSHEDASILCDEILEAFPIPEAGIPISQAKKLVAAALKVCIRHLEAK